MPIFPGVGFRLSVLSVCSMACLLTMVPGCQGWSGPALHGASGTVTLDGVPVELGSITFFPDASNKEGATAGAVIEKGTYTVPAEKGLMEGNYQVRISWNRKTGKKVEATSPHPPGTMIEETAEAIPAKYNTESTLTAAILPEENKGLDFELKSGE